MTQQYLAGELSLLLAQLQAVATNSAFVRDLGRLRQEAETMPLTTLSLVAVRALEVADDVCWDSLERGDIAAFVRQTTICAELWQFGSVPIFSMRHRTGSNTGPSWSVSRAIADATGGVNRTSQSTRWLWFDSRLRHPEGMLLLVVDAHETAIDLPCHIPLEAPDDLFLG